MFIRTTSVYHNATDCHHDKNSCQFRWVTKPCSHTCKIYLETSFLIKPSYVGTIAVREGVYTSTGEVVDILPFLTSYITKMGFQWTEWCLSQLMEIGYRMHHWSSLHQSELETLYTALPFYVCFMRRFMCGCLSRSKLKQQLPVVFPASPWVLMACWICFSSIQSILCSLI